MYRNRTIIAALTLCAVLLAGCGGKPAASSGNAVSAGNAVVSSGNAASAGNAVVSSGNAAGAGNAAAFQSAAPEGPAAPEKNSMYNLLEGVFDDLHFGTAGSSLTAAWYAASIVDWGVKNGPEAVRAGASAWDRGTVNEFGEELSDKLSYLYATAYSFYGRRLGLLEDCGWEGTWDHTGRDVRDVFQILFPALGMETPLIAAAFVPDDEAEYLLAYGVELAPEDMADPVRALNTLINYGAVPEGAGALSESLSGGVLTLDMNEAFAGYVRSLGTSGELLAVSAVVNTALLLFDGAESVLLTVEGRTLETGHQIYDDPISFYEE